MFKLVGGKLTNRRYQAPGHETPNSAEKSYRDDPRERYTCFCGVRTLFRFPRIYGTPVVHICDPRVLGVRWFADMVESWKIHVPVRLSYTVINSKRLCLKQELQWAH